MNLYEITISDGLVTKIYYQTASKSHVAISRLVEYAQRYQGMKVEKFCSLTCKIYTKNYKPERA